MISNFVSLNFQRRVTVAQEKLRRIGARWFLDKRIFCREEKTAKNPEYGYGVFAIDGRIANELFHSGRKSLATLKTPSN